MGEEGQRVKAKLGVKAYLKPGTKNDVKIKLKAEAGEGQVTLTWKVTGKYTYVLVILPGDRGTTDVTATDKAGFPRLQRKVDTDFADGNGGWEESVSYQLVAQDENHKELAFQSVEVKRPEEEAAHLKFSFSHEVSLLPENLPKLCEGHTPYFKYEAEVEVKMVSGGLTYSGGEAKTTGDFFKELSERPGDAWDAIRQKLLGDFAPIFAADGDQNPFLSVECEPPSVTNSDSDADVTLVEFALKFNTLPRTPKAKIAIKALSWDKKEGGPPKVGEIECGIEATINTDGDIPLFGGWTWNSPQGSAGVVLTIEPEWEKIARPVIEWLAELLEGGVAGEAAVGLAVIVFLICEIYAMSEDADVQKEIQAGAMQKRKGQLKPNMINGYKYGITEGSTTPPPGASAAFQAGFKMGVARRGGRAPINLTQAESKQIDDMLAADPKFDHVASGLTFKSFYDWLQDQSLANKTSTILDVAFLNAFGYEHAADPTQDDRKLFKQITGRPY